MERGSEVTDIGFSGRGSVTVPPRAAGDRESPLTGQAGVEGGGGGGVNLGTEGGVSICLKIKTKAFVHITYVYSCKIHMGGKECHLIFFLWVEVLNALSQKVYEW